MGVFPMAPHPGNSHPISLLPDPYVDSLYLAYGPLMNVMKDREWILKPHVINVKNKVAKANLFAVPKGYAIPVVYPISNVAEVEVEFEPKDASKIASCLAYYPGLENPKEIKFKRYKNKIKFTLPLNNKSCAMVLVKSQ